MKELAAILIVWQATPLDQPYEPEPDNEVCRELKVSLMSRQKRHDKASAELNGGNPQQGQVGAGQDRQCRRDDTSSAHASRPRG
jgi:hypothetical protein